MSETSQRDDTPSRTGVGQSTSLDATGRRLRAQIAVNTRWGKTADRKAATAAARRGLRAKYEREVDPDGKLDPAERDLRVDSLMKAHMLRMTLAASDARARRRAEAQGASEAHGVADGT